MKPGGWSLIGGSRCREGDDEFRAIDPSSGSPLDPPFHSATERDVDRAAGLAANAFRSYGMLEPQRKATFLRRIASGLQGEEEALILRAADETALPESRLRSELQRTCHQLRMFADLVDEGWWVDARIDRGDPGRQPVPKPDLRSMRRPLGPVAVFGASNFPLAFSVAGGDTASALAAGCPVIVKAHPSHPGTSEIAGQVVVQAVRECDLHDGVFSLLLDSGFEIGMALVRHPAIKAVGFTGSRRGGIALARAVSARPEPIPVYAEMGSINPVFILSGALRERGGAIAAGLHRSVTTGVGQFCTNPGLIITAGKVSRNSLFIELKEHLSTTPPAVMLSRGICEAYQAGLRRMSDTDGVETATVVGAAVTSGSASAGPALFMTTADRFLSDRSLQDELFGPATLIVACGSYEKMLDVANSLEGQLTVTIHGTEDDLRENADLVRVLEGKGGRIVFNGYPTGVEVAHSMVHGGPFPATLDGRSTSVGTRAIERFTRPVAYQDAPDALLPDELKESNPLGVRRLVDGAWSA